MKKLIFTITVLCITIPTLTYGQIVESSCEAPDSIVQKYQDDADALTLRKFYENDLPWADSIEIPDEHSDTVLNALLAVWNADGLAARDTVVGMLDIHVRPDYSVNTFGIGADSSLNWIHQLSEGNIPCGNDTVDSIINQYNLLLDSFNDYSGTAFVYFVSNVNMNMAPIAMLFDPIYGVNYVFDTPSIIDGDDIHCNIFDDYVELTYIRAWGDCPSGCTGHRYWKFKVYYDCSVEFTESYGDILPGTGINNTNGKYNINVFPNPCKNYIILEGTIKNDFPLTYAIYNSNGIKVLTGKTTNKRIKFNGKLNNGLYILELYTDTETIRKKIQIQKH